MITGFPQNPLEGTSNTNRMVFWRDWLQRHLEVKTILELGRSDGTGSTWYFVESGCEVWSVDIEDTEPGNPNPRGFAQFVAFDLLKYPNYHHIVADDRQPIPEIDDKKFDLVFLDTSHEYEHTKYELNRYFPMATKWFAVDDFHWSTETPALREYTGNWEFIGGNDIYAVKKA